MQSRTDGALRKIIQDSKAPLKTKRECLAAMEAPSSSFLAELVNGDYPPKLKVDAASRLAEIQEAKRHRAEVDAILKQETERLAKRDPNKNNIPPVVQAPGPVIPKASRPQIGQNDIRNILGAEPAVEREVEPAVEHDGEHDGEGGHEVAPPKVPPVAQPTPIAATQATNVPVPLPVAPTVEAEVEPDAPKIPALAVQPVRVSVAEGERERAQYHALFASRFGREKLNPSLEDPILRQQCNSADLEQIDAAYFQARRKIEAGKNFDNADCGDERTVLRDWTSTPGKGVDGLGRKTFEGKIADALWDELEALAKTVKHLPEREPEYE